MLSTLVAAVLVPAGVRGLVSSGHTRVNYRGTGLAFPLGAIIFVSSLVALAPLAALDARAGGDLLPADLGRWPVYLAGVAFLGLLDDALGRGEASDTARGWRGHASAVLSGRLSTGAVKAVGSLALAVYVLASSGGGWAMYAVDVALLILVTNLFNLLDLRGGRVEKGLACLVALVCLAGWSPAAVELAGVFLGPFLVGGWFTLKERAMLGDTGSNLAGAVAGMILITQLSQNGRSIALVIAILITVYGEFRSISQTIDRFPPLRFIDSLGRGQ